jgi:nitrite reductase/ring-hydroxylating ferredoxin subunit
VYRPETGVCERGPCQGERLKQVAIEERDGHVYLLKGVLDV